MAGYSRGGVTTGSTRMASIQFRLIRSIFTVLPSKYWAFTPRPTLMDRMLKRQVSPEPLKAPAARREADRKLMARIPLPKDVTAEPLTMGGVPGLKVRHKDAIAGRTVLYLHGGGYVYLSPESHKNIGAAISREARCEVFLADYRLGPEQPFPGAVDDAVGAWEWLLSQGQNPRLAAIAGDSAGGGLTFAALLRLKEARKPLPAAAVGISPWTDLALTGDSITSRASQDPMLNRNDLDFFARNYLAGSDPKNPLASPLYGDMSGFPPLLIQVGTDEILFDDAVRIHEKATRAGIPSTLDVWKDMIHVWHAGVPFVPESRDAIARIGTFLDSHWKG